MGFLSVVKTFFCDLFGIETKEEKEAKIRSGEMSPPSQEATSDEDKKAKENQWQSADDSLKFVCMGGKVQCPFCSSPIADIVVTSTTIMLQDKPWATVGDNDGKINFAFTGVCNHPSQQKPFSPPPPCKAVINLGQWKDFSETYVGNDKALLMKSTIPCMISNQDIKIVDSGQRTTLSEVEPRMERKLRIVESFWVDEGLSYKLEHLAFEDVAYLYIRTVDYKPNEVIRIPLLYEQVESDLIGRVDEKGEVLIKWQRPQ